ncbi:MAG: MotA/TolQ/ExbB proton channel family protein [Butyrivibrio sp.]|uniref:MotA/TolQ/ExbB proton channel family protein n=1 Tax=Butyrivibrio sp. TaxID=28121 RepID=UPI001B4ED9A2|nr:MotA/TolQ/ExbB proton channel family protein [Butyrivibrio sp.]MBP3784285.1 MotA/TolQ/ExbB proton channel family protein [Butyrivibrio sp.]
MSRKRGYEILILITYLAMSAVCIYLQFFSKNQAGGLENLIVNVTMLVIAGIIFASCVFGSLLPTASMTADLIEVAQRFEEDAKTSHNYLWDQYINNKDDIFEDKRLLRHFKDYKLELSRISGSSDVYYKCDIEDFIGYDLIDSVIHRERLSQVPGVMTGLGILGTFVGLSLGLQSFNTGTTAEITGSIEPLMNGIKVAFHTSIYGMVFSLIFNYVYKRRLDDAENALNYFVRNFKKYVLPDTDKLGVNRMMELQSQQTKAITELTNALTHELPEGLKTYLEPQFDHLDSTIDSFSRMATRNQMDQLERVVENFITEMNKTLGNSFSDLSKVVSQTMYVQEANERQLKEMYEKNAVAADGMVKAVNEMENVTKQLKDVSESVSKYVKEVRTLEAQIASFGNK